MWEKINPSRHGGINLLLGLAILIVLGLYFLWQLGQGRKAVVISREAMVATNSPVVSSAVSSSATVISSTKSDNKINNLNEVTSKPSGKYLGSKTGKKYHLPECGGAKRIKEENKVWFASKAEAEKAGYSPAGNCKGI